MKKMETWFFTREEEKLCITSAGRSRGEVKDIEPAKTVGFVRIILMTMEILKLCVESFDYKGSSICRSMTEPSSPGSRTSFIKRWRKYLKADSSSSNSSNESTDTETSNSFSMNEDLAVSTDECTVKKATVTGIQDAALKKHFLGTYDVHVNNLIPPAASRATRVVDHDHVGVLTESYQEQGCGQFVILVGLIEDNVKVDDLRRQTANCKVEVLGGNHTREALQSLQKKGVLVSETVKVNIYKDLTRTAALAIGYQHNVILHEKKKPMSFLDKVRLMRTCKQEDSSSWKEMLVLVFREKDRRSLQQRYGIHIQMAALTDCLWSKVVRHGDVNEKFYRPLMRLNSEEVVDSCLDTLLSEGVTNYKRKVQQLIDDGKVKSKKKAKQVSNQSSGATSDSLHTETETENMDVDLEHELLEVKKDYIDLQEKYNTLVEENKRLKKQLLDGDRGTKRIRDITDEAFRSNEKVEAFWRYEDGKEDWLTATVVTVYADGKMMKVRYDVDKTSAKVSKSWVRKI